MRFFKIIPACLFGLLAFSSVAHAAPSPQPSTLTIPDGTFGGEVTGQYTGDKRALGDVGFLIVKCYDPVTGVKLYENGFDIQADGSFVVTPLAGWGTGWESGPADCVADAGFISKRHDNKYNPDQREWIVTASDTFHVFA